MQEAVAAALARRSERTEVTADRVLTELVKLGRHLGIYNDKLELKGRVTLEQLVVASYRPDRGKP